MVNLYKLNLNECENYICNDVKQIGDTICINIGITNPDWIPANNVEYKLIGGSDAELDVDSFLNLLSEYDVYCVDNIYISKYADSGVLSSESIININNDLINRMYGDTTEFEYLYCVPCFYLQGDIIYIGLYDVNSGNIVFDSLLLDSCYDINEYEKYKYLLMQKINT